MNSAVYFLENGLSEGMSKIETAAYTIAALCHDVGHPGVNNAYLIATKSREAIVYNDDKVLESFHSAFTFELLN
jgi:hypothetical protein